MLIKAEAIIEYVKACMNSGWPDDAILNRLLLVCNQRGVEAGVHSDILRDGIVDCSKGRGTHCEALDVEPIGERVHVKHVSRMDA